MSLGSVLGSSDGKASERLDAARSAFTTAKEDDGCCLGCIYDRATLHSDQDCPRQEWKDGPVNVRGHEVLLCKGRRRKVENHTAMPVS